ncbi:MULTISPECIES: cytidine deaminase [Paenibacillus]|jgi:cytidine deaminase|uniref:Cytidine deaminase n=3 Tax=Paenibacillus TaxID=44249 RepID=R9LH28_9BACL|nr:MULTISPECIES: cytidine deaminase [Paenibacillus]EOS57838.1 cytidine deaminase [Paenibacillus barengoltzii G22]MEC2346600.1 cytidine deaminase [Paenibacillus barengoltzii]SMF08250.1 cytidine deaminase [Paenibacillus barengoltzii]SMF35503.1 cytidine deaminase [Paenibacillus barengoltzii J12]
MDYGQLMKEAIEARKAAYIPYSGFGVGAALLDSKGQVHHGCNIENAAYSPGNCAERTAMFRAIADGHQPGTFQAIAVVADTEEPVAPCGVCRQVLFELCGPDMPVILGNLKGDIRQTTVRELLPYAFGPSHLEEQK